MNEKKEKAIKKKQKKKDYVMKLSNYSLMTIAT
jgi:hypothetical protein